MQVKQNTNQMSTRQIYLIAFFNKKTNIYLKYMKSIQILTVLKQKETNRQKMMEPNISWWHFY